MLYFVDKWVRFLKLFCSVFRYTSYKPLIALQFSLRRRQSISFWYAVHKADIIPIFVCLSVCLFVCLFNNTLITLYRPAIMFQSKSLRFFKNAQSQRATKNFQKCQTQRATTIKKSPVFVCDNHFFALDIAKHDSTAFFRRSRYILTIIPHFSLFHWLINKHPG